MKTRMKASARGGRVYRVTEPESAFEDWTRTDPAEPYPVEATIVYHEARPGGVCEERHAVGIWHRHDINRPMIMRRFETVEAARGAWVEARAELAALGYTRVRA